MKTLEEKNAMIAEFMGYEIMYRPFGEEFIEISDTELCDLNDLKYHDSWDWLMPVAERIESICGCHLLITPTVTNIEYKKIKISQWQHSKIKNTYEAVCEFIKMYNENK